MPSLQHYFTAEMQRLDELAQAFANAYPEQASQLNLQALKDRDPHVERLLEGCAFLSAQLRQHIEQRVPDFTELLLQQMCPTFIRPFPSMSILEFSPRRHERRVPISIPKHTVVRGADCAFRTMTSITLHPFSVKSVSAKDRLPQGSVIRLILQSDSANMMPGANLTFYLHAEPLLSVQLYYLLRTATEIRATAGLQSVPLRIHATRQYIANMTWFQNYFYCRDTYLFVTFTGLDKVNWKAVERDWAIDIETQERLPSECILKSSMFRLHCVPAENLFSMTAEPLRKDADCLEYPLKLNSIDKESCVLYSVDDVRSTRGVCQRHRILTHDISRADIAAYLQLDGSEKSAQSNETISVQVTACDGHTPHQKIRANETAEVQGELRDRISTIFLTRPTDLMSPPAVETWRAALVQYLVLHRASLTTLTHFKQFLYLCCQSEQKESERRIESLETLTVTPITFFRCGVMYRGACWKFTVQESGFLSTADIYLLGEVIHTYLKMSAPFHHQTRTILACHPSRKEFLWE